MSDEDKRYDPTPHRREQFRREGKFARARDAGAVLTIVACAGALAGTRGAIARSLHELFARTLGDLAAPAPLETALGALLAMSAPAAVACAIAGVVAGAAQSGLHLQTELLFKTDRFDPVARLQQMLSPKQGTLEVALALARVAAVGYVAYRALREEAPALLGLGRLPLDAAAEQMTSSVTHVTLAGVLALGVSAALDYAQSRFQLEKQMRMSQKEMMEETRAQEGDPKQKAKMRARARALAKRRAVANVKSASVVITNPTHVSVAVRYDQRDVAPVVVAKGHDEIALKIRAQARKHGIPIFENRKLARALDAEVRIGHTIPAAHFVAVARVLAWVMRLRPARRVRSERS